ncbi:MAG: response regulator [Oscillospiraceae bacterium]|nr:response regulator [Oscillospiraceae bacterium]
MYSIYIVDDEYLVIKDLVSRIPWLENGFEVVGHSTNAFTALAEITDIKPDAIICDLKMPTIDGIELIRRLKAGGASSEFVMLSAYGDFNASRDFFLMNGFDYLLKPLEQDNASLVLERLNRKIAKNRADQADQRDGSADPADQRGDSADQPDQRDGSVDPADQRGGSVEPSNSRINKTAPSIRTPPPSDKFDALVAYVTKNFNKKHTLGDLNHKFNMHPTYICDLFAKHYQSTLTMFVTSLRMKEAARLILESDIPLKELSSLCGYMDYYHFCKVFKSYYGMPPSMYRERGGDR